MDVTVLLALSGVYGSSDVRVWLMTAVLCLNFGGRLGGCAWHMGACSGGWNCRKSTFCRGIEL